MTNACSERGRSAWSAVITKNDSKPELLLNMPGLCKLYRSMVYSSKLCRGLKAVPRMRLLGDRKP